MSGTLHQPIWFARHHSVVWPHLIDGLSLCHCPLEAKIKWTHYCISLYFCNTVSSDFRLFHENLEGSDGPDLTWRPPLPHWRTGNVPPPTIQRLLPPNTKIPIGIQTSIFPDCFLQSTNIYSQYTQPQILTVVSKYKKEHLHRVKQ